tara:strand:- start:17 stop:514 length:498 start_codon:yes stop_codon:yes gene_type:complete
MKQFNHFRKDIDEAAAAVAAIPKIAKLAKFAVPAAMTLVGGVGTYLQSRGNGESNFENLRKQQQAGKGDKLKKKSEEDAEKPSTREKIKNALVDAGLSYRKGLSAGRDVESTSSTGIIGSVSDEFREKEGGKSPAQVARELIAKQRQNMKDKRLKNKKIDDKLGK